MLDFSNASRYTHKEESGAAMNETTSIISHIRDVVKTACYDDTNTFGPGIWDHHIVHVVRHGKRLAEQRQADEEVVELAALLHDYAGIKNPDWIKEHHIHGANEADQLLSELNYSREKIELVKACILCHRGSVPHEKTSVEAECLADADAMAHFDSVPSLFYYLFTSTEKNIDEAAQWLSAKLERSWNKLSPFAKTISREKYEACQLVLGQMG